MAPGRISFLKETKVHKVNVELSNLQAEALAQMCKRFGQHHATELSNQYDPYPDGRSEREHMIDAVDVLRGALRDAGFAPR